MTDLDSTDLDEIAAGIQSLPDVLRTLLSPIDDRVLRARPGEDEWSVLEIIGHLIDGDAPAFRDRIRSIVDGNGEIVGFDPAVAIAERDFNAESLDSLIDELAEQRRQSARYLVTLSADDLARTANYPENGIFAAADFVHEWPFHDHDHLQQILAILKSSRLVHMTDAMRRALNSDDDGAATDSDPDSARR